MVDRRACPLGYRLSYIVRFEIEDALEPSLSRGDSKRTRGKDDRDENEPYGYPKHVRKPSRSPLPRQHTFAALIIDLGGSVVDFGTQKFGTSPSRIA